MKIEEFAGEFDEYWDDIKNGKEAFVSNMKNLLGEQKDQSFCQWIMTFLAWSELGDIEDCQNFYGNED